MSKFVRVNEVDAEPMKFGVFKAKFPKSGGANIERNPEDEGYVITYRKGTPREYVSWCPKGEFDAVSRKIDSMSFGTALELMKRGKEVARKEWAKDKTAIWLGIGTICKSTMNLDGSHKVVCTGWLPSQVDILSDDWSVISDKSIPH